VLKPALEDTWDVNDDDDQWKFITVYVAYGVFCLLIYYFVVMPLLDLPELDLTGI
jgi:hypothetical protein